MIDLNSPAEWRSPRFVRVQQRQNRSFASLVSDMKIVLVTEPKYPGLGIAGIIVATVFCSVVYVYVWVQF